VRPWHNEIYITSAVGQATKAAGNAINGQSAVTFVGCDEINRIIFKQLYRVRNLVIAGVTFSLTTALD
jgi:hypothetical protein